MREGERVTPLELFFDLVFVLALTQCTTLMAGTPTWLGLLEGPARAGDAVVVVGRLRLADERRRPGGGVVRLVMFAAMAAFFIAALCVPGAFGADALLFAIAYAAVDRPTSSCSCSPAARSGAAPVRSSAWPAARRSRGACCRGGVRRWRLRVGLWGLALVLDAAGPYLFGADGWKLVPGHFAERHGAIVIIALGESIVAIGVGARQKIDTGYRRRGPARGRVAATLWWAYFDVTAIVAGRRLAKASPGREQNEIARDSYSYLHFPMVAGIALLAVGLKRTWPTSMIR